MGLLSRFYKEKPITVYVQTGNKSITNTLTETSFLNGDHYGSNIIPDRLINEYSHISVRVFGTLSTVSTPQATLRFYFNDLKIIESLGTLPNNLANTYYDVLMEITFGHDKSYMNVNGRTIFQTAGGIATPTLRGFFNNQLAFTKASSYTLNTTYQWGTASTGNILNIQNYCITVC